MVLTSQLVLVEQPTQQCLSYQYTPQLRLSWLVILLIIQEYVEFNMCRQYINYDSFVLIILTLFIRLTKYLCCKINATIPFRRGRLLFLLFECSDAFLWFSRIKGRKVVSIPSYHSMHSADKQLSVLETDCNCLVVMSKSISIVQIVADGKNLAIFSIGNTRISPGAN